MKSELLSSLYLTLSVFRANNKGVDAAIGSAIFAANNVSIGSTSHSTYERLDITSGDGKVTNTLTDGPLKQPGVLSSEKGDLRINLALAECEHRTVAADTLRTRCLGGSLPGPTVRVRPGEWLRIQYTNDLVQQEGTSTEMNNFAFPDSTNLHFHGAHVSGEAPSSDTLLSIEPGESYQYEVFFPEFHAPGIFWIHPHRHGSGTLQVGGGAAMPLIVEDGPGDVPPEVEDAEEVILMVQLFDNDTMENKVKERSGDKLFLLEPAQGVGEDFRLVNGQYKPTLKIIAGEWQRWRVIYGSWNDDPLDLAMNSNGKCEMILLAKDGIYIEDYPRPLDKFPIVTGGRADIMVRCSSPGVFTVTDYGGTLMTLLSEAPVGGKDAIDFSTPPTEGFKFNRPSYLRDLQDASPTPGCSCETYMDDDMMNGMKYDPNLFLHTVALGSIVQRNVTGVEGHPYHQHVYPFQLQEFYGIDEEDSKYFKVGDYHDSVTIRSSDTVLIRYEPHNFHGRVAVHCHKITHSDEGMLSAEDVVDPSDGGVCQCSPKMTAMGFRRPANYRPPTVKTTKTDKADKTKKGSASTNKKGKVGKTHKTDKSTASERQNSPSEKKSKSVHSPTSKKAKSTSDKKAKSEHKPTSTTETNLSGKKTKAVHKPTFKTEKSLSAKKSKAVHSPVALLGI